jgi:hypothetical protein
MQGWNSPDRLSHTGLLPVFHQFVLIQFNPRFHQALLATRQCTLDHINGGDAANSTILLVGNMNVRQVMLYTRFSKDTDDDTIEAGDFRHPFHLPSIAATLVHDILQFVTSHIAAQIVEKDRHGPFVIMGCRPRRMGGDDHILHLPQR